MQQTLHIFKKDARHLWFEISVVIIAVVGFAFTGAEHARWLVDPRANRTAAWTIVLILLPLAWWALIARVIHAEVLPGDRQFWITRPYSRKSLLLAKVLFIAVFINVPMLLADAIIVRAYGLHPLGAQLPGLLWSQVLLTIVFLLPIAALSAVTAGFVQLIFAVLIPCVVALLFAIVAPQTVLGAFLGPFEWVRTYYAFLVITLGGLAVLIWQYWRRRTSAAREFIVAMVVLGVVGMLSIPWPAAFAIQSLLSRQTADSSSVRVIFDSGNSAGTVTQPDGRVRIILQVNVTGVLNRTIAKVEGFSVALEAPDGTVWRSKQISPMSAMLRGGQEFTVETTVSRPFYLKVKDGTFKARGSLYLTLFGNPQTSNIPFGDRPVTVPGVGACSASRGPNGLPYFLVCSSAFRFPLARVSYHFLDATQGTLRTVSSSTQPRLISYAPFPASPGINPVSQDMTFSIARGPVSEASVSTLKPVAYLRRPFGGEVKLEVK